MAAAPSFGKNKNPTAGLAMGFEKAQVNESKPDRRAAQQQRRKQQVQIHITIHTVLIGYFAVLVKFNFPFHSPNCPVLVSMGEGQTRC
jgi:hypothetical protein